MEAAGGRRLRRVLHVMASLERSGMETMLFSAASEWERHGYACDVLATAATPGPFTETLRKAGYPVFHLPLRSERAHWWVDLRSLKAFRRMAARYDVLHIHVEAGATLYALAARSAGVRRLARSIHNTFRFRGFLRLRKWASRALCRALGVRFGMVSDSVAACERMRFGNTGVRTSNWLDTDYFRPAMAAECAAARVELGCGAGDFVLVSVGNCNAAKNHAALLGALPALRARSPLLLHVGREQPGEPERELARSLGIESMVRFDGSQADPRTYFWAADAFVMPSLYEGLGVAALEAIACACPAVLSDVPGLCEVLAVAHHAVPCGTTVEAVSDGLRRLCARPAEDRREGALADSHRVREDFSPRRGVETMVRALYEPKVGER